MTKIAVYGTLRQGYGNHPVLGKSPLIGSGWTEEKYKLTADGIPFVNPNEQISQVRVEVYEVSDEQLPRVDGLEGYDPNNHEGSWYKRVAIPVLLDGDETPTTASIYFGDHDGQTLIESGDYADYRTIITPSM